MTWENLDEQMSAYQDRLVGDLKLDVFSSRKLATTISSEVRFLTKVQKDELRHATPVKLKDRLDELKAFQDFMEQSHIAGWDREPHVTRAKVIVQNYICFVYLSEACFLVLRKNMKTGSATKKCAKYLTDNPIRSFRNAIAHSNWTYNHDFGALRYWARKGAEKDEPLIEHSVEQADLGFWQALSRSVAYAAFSNL